MGKAMDACLDASLEGGVSCKLLVHLDRTHESGGHKILAPLEVVTQALEVETDIGGDDGQRGVPQTVTVEKGARRIEDLLFTAIEATASGPRELPGNEIGRRAIEHAYSARERLHRIIVRPRQRQRRPTGTIRASMVLADRDPTCSRWDSAP